ncbi:hypothetical protein D9756_007244 [Leucocoprinus leucothites]|uniref:DNA polymerase epsilon catalytic subunit n=1 Tax=Leucocoprinus leucothites TaxID=201217 RepID=A0A8H5D6Z3_9AGAR|nr:hypothetical protein D9756_007244 [Leucoagaricus leucothites]
MGETRLVSPSGKSGLKAVTTAKLGYNPIELDPELMTPYGMEQLQVLAQYSVSDAVATYYLYMKYVHPFIFSLCNIIPLNPDEVLRKGSGTLCKTLLMAYRGHVIMPNRHGESHGSMYEGHLLASETYVGGHVEALEAGVFCSDIPTDFKIVPAAAQQLVDELDAALQFCIVEESEAELEDVTNYDEVKGDIQNTLETMRDNPRHVDKPLIYHLDVAAMYANIMLSNCLQPDSINPSALCAIITAQARPVIVAQNGRGEENSSLLVEDFLPKKPGGPKRKFVDLSPSEQTALLHKRLGDYSRKVYTETKDIKVKNRLLKTWKKKSDESKRKIVLYDSLQLAHKRILNSFHGYVMRKGARWHSMEMAGITCLTGSTIIQLAQNFKFKLKNGKSIGFSYPCTMLNHLVHAKFTNHQYHHLDPETGEYKVHSENSIFFELDVPYKAMILSSSKEEDKLLKMRYAVFNDDGSLVESKGFEVKRRGELQLTKIFQSQIFEKFLLGSTTQEWIAHPAWLHRRILKTTEKFKQNKVTDFFGKKSDMPETQEETQQEETQASEPMDIEDVGGEQAPKATRIRIAVVRKKTVRQQMPQEEDMEDHLYRARTVIIMALSRPCDLAGGNREIRMDGGASASVGGSSLANINKPSLFKGVKVQTRNRWDIVQIR